MEKNFEQYNVDMGKLDVEITHDYYPLEEDKSVYVTCNHLGSTGLLGVIDAENRDADFGKLFIRQVKAVHGITVKGKGGVPVEVTPRMLVEIPDPDFMKIVLNTCMHLITHRNFTEEESKN